MGMKKLKLNKKFVRDARNSLTAILNIVSVIVLLRGLYILTETTKSEEYNVVRPLLLVICGIFILLISNLIISGKEGRPKNAKSGCGGLLAFIGMIAMLYAGMISVSRTWAEKDNQHDVWLLYTLCCGVFLFITGLIISAIFGASGRGLHGGSGSSGGSCGSGCGGGCGGGGCGGGG